MRNTHEDIFESLDKARGALYGNAITLLALDTFISMVHDSNK